MKLDDYNVVFAIVGLIGVVLFVLPTLSLILPLPGGEEFSELWILGPSHIAENYPFNVRAGDEYLVHAGVGNHMGSSVYYVVCVKFRNQTEPLPDATAGLPSPLLSLYEYRVFLRDGENWEAPLTFSFSKVSFLENRSSVGSLMINDVAFDVDKLTFRDAENNGYYYQLFIELWIFNKDSDSFQFHNRFVGLWLNITG